MRPRQMGNDGVEGGACQSASFAPLRPSTAQRAGNRGDGQTVLLVYFATTPLYLRGRRPRKSQHGRGCLGGRPRGAKGSQESGLEEAFWGVSPDGAA